MDQDELEYWMALHQISPITPDRLDYLAAMLATVQANLWSKKPHKLNDFLIKWGTDDKGDKINKMRSWILTHGKPKQTPK
jgi:hypothetical protein